MVLSCRSHIQASYLNKKKILSILLYGSHRHLIFSTHSQNPRRQGSIIIIVIFNKLPESQELGENSSRQQESVLTELSLDFLSCRLQGSLLVTPITWSADFHSNALQGAISLRIISSWQTKRRRFVCCLCLRPRICVAYAKDSVNALVLFRRSVDWLGSTHTRGKPALILCVVNRFKC